MPKTGAFISIEGGEGAGKTLQRRLLSEKLKAAGFEVVETREPGGSPGAEEIRKLLVTGAGDRWSGKAEVLLFNAARVDHLEKTILPALRRGAVVVCDRFIGSSLAYQSVGRGVPKETILETHRLFCEDVFPDLTLILDIDPVAGLTRAKARNTGAQSGEDRFEGLDLSFHQALRASFLDQAAKAPHRHAVIDASKAPDDVAAAIWTAARAALARRA